MGREPIPPGRAGHVSKPRQLSPGQWQASCRFRKPDGTFTRVIRIRQSSQAARAALDDAIDELKNRSDSETLLKPHHTVNKAADLWIATVESEQLATTHGTYLHLLDHHVRPALGALRLREVNVPAVQGMFDTLRAKGLAPATLRIIKTVVLGVMETAVVHGAMRDNPATKVRRIRSGTRKAPRALTPQERIDLLAKLTELATTPTETRGENGRTYRGFACDPDLPDLATFMLGTGVRIGEALGVRWGDLAVAEVVTADGIQQVPVVHITGNVVRVSGVGLVRHDGKTETAVRVIPVPAFVGEMLARRRPEDAPPDRPVFCASTLGYRDPSNTRRSLRKARDAAGYPWVTSHVWRKTAASEWRRMGLDSTAVADLLGHAQVSVTQDVYFGRQQLNPDAAAQMDAAWTDS